MLAPRAMPTSSSRSGTGIIKTPLPLSMNAIFWPGRKARRSRTVLGIETWYFDQSFDVAVISYLSPIDHNNTKSPIQTDVSTTRIRTDRFGRDSPLYIGCAGHPREVFALRRRNDPEAFGLRQAAAPFARGPH